MKEVKVSLQSNLAHGTLLWIYASNKKVYHSSKRFDTEEFIEHESNYMGEFEEIYPMKNRQYSAVLRLLKKSDRIFGICLREKDGQGIPVKGSEKTSILFFATLDELMGLAEPHFAEYDRLEAKREKEAIRKREAKEEWIARGKHFLKDSNISLKET